MTPVILFIVLLHVSQKASGQEVSYWSWTPVTQYKTTAVVPKNPYYRASQLCNRLRASLLTFSRSEMNTLASELQKMYRSEEFWIGMTKDSQGNIYWNDGELVNRMAFDFANNIHQSTINVGGKSCGYISILDSNSVGPGKLYTIDFAPCENSKKGLCEKSQLLDPIGIMAVTALSVSILCLLFILGILFKWCCCRAHDNYMMRHRKNGTSPKIVTHTQC